MRCLMDRCIIIDGVGHAVLAEEEGVIILYLYEDPNTRHNYTIPYNNYFPMMYGKRVKAVGSLPENRKNHQKYYLWVQNNARKLIEAALSALPIPLPGDPKLW